MRAEARAPRPRRAVRLIAAVAMTTALAACVGSLAELDERGRNVAVIPAPLPGCTYVSSSYGRRYFQEYALNNLRNQVGSSGATHVVITDATQLMQGFLPVGGNSLTIHGIGYKCPAGAAPKR